MANNFYHIIIGVLLLVVITLMTCNGCKQKEIDKLKAGQGTVTKVDTVWKRDSFKTVEYEPVYTTITRVKEVPKYITVKGEIVPIDTVEILKDYFAKVYYHDSVSTQYGRIDIMDTVSQNRIQSRVVKTNFRIPEITKTITLPSRNQVYVGLIGQYARHEYLLAGGASIMYKSKLDKVFEVGALYSKYNHLFIQGSVKIKLSFKN